MASRYGDIGQGFIHIHHLIPLSGIKQDYRLNPETDLIPVCPNCHAMLHRRDPPFTPEELKARLRPAD
jgi:predicted HNH restriction endonuclease